MIEANDIHPYIVCMESINVGDLVRYKPDVIDDVGAVEDTVGLVVAERNCVDLNGVDKAYLIVLWPDGSKGYIDKYTSVCDVYRVDL